MHGAALQMNVLVAFALAYHLGFLITTKTRGYCVRTSRDGAGAYLAEGVGELSLHVLHDGRDLALERQLVAKVEPGGVDDGEQQPVVARLAYLDAGRVYLAGRARRPAQKVLERDALLRRRGGRDLRGLEQQPEQRRLPEAACADDLRCARGIMSGHGDNAARWQRTMTLNVVGSFLLWLGRMRACVDLRLSNALGGGGAVYSAEIGPPAGCL